MYGQKREGLHVIDKKETAAKVKKKVFFLNISLHDVRSVRRTCFPGNIPYIQRLGRVSKRTSLGEWCQNLSTNRWKVWNMNVGNIYRWRWIRWIHFIIGLFAFPKQCNQDGREKNEHKEWEIEKERICTSRHSLETSKNLSTFLSSSFAFKLFDFQCNANGSFSVSMFSSIIKGILRVVESH